MVRLLLALYVAITFGPLAVAMVVWSIRDSLRFILKDESKSAARADGSEEGLELTVEQMRVIES